MSDTFIEKRKADWKRLDELTERLRRASGKRGLRHLTRDEVRQLGRDYRRAASDLAIARVESRDQRLVSYLNNLVIRTHSLIYRSKSHGLRSIYDFYRFDFPSIFRRTSKYTAAVFLIFAVISALSFTASWRDDEFAEFAYISPETMADIRAQKMWTGGLNKQAPLGAAFIMANNLGVGFRTFAMSVLPLIGTAYTLLPSALQFGSISALVIKYKMAMKLFSFVAGHGVLEFTAIFLCGGAGLMIGLALLAPGDRTRQQALLERGAMAIKLLAGCIPLLVIAGLIEAFISPLPIHAGFKFATSAITAIILIAYLNSGRQRAE